jgi:hypothetical protein
LPDTAEESPIQRHRARFSQCVVAEAASFRCLTSLYSRLPCTRLHRHTSINISTPLARHVASWQTYSPYFLFPPESTRNNVTQMCSHVVLNLFRFTAWCSFLANTPSAAETCIEQAGEFWTETTINVTWCSEHEFQFKQWTFGFACYLLHVGFLLGLFVNPEDVGDVPPKHELTFSALHSFISQKTSLHNHRCKNLKSYRIFSCCHSHQTD